LREIFERQFGRPPETTASAPGRVNIIGEHTDYNGGFMLPIALPHRTHVLIANRSDTLVSVRSADVIDAPLQHYVLGHERPSGGWLDYVQGVTWLARATADTAFGCDILISSTVPLGKGLSSSAALQVALLRALNDAWHLEVDALAIAKLAHRAETQFVGAPVGVMDQMAASFGDEATALLIDARSFAFEHVRLPADVDLAVFDSGISHRHAGGEYRVRHHECEAAAGLLGVAQLRELSVADLPRLRRLPSTLARRARHVITENARVLKMVRAFRESDAVTAGALLSASHDSLRDDFEVSTRDIDCLVELACAESDVLGARITGGGFGGAVVALCQRPHTPVVARRVMDAYRSLTNRDGAVLFPRPS
jgi:galactokinase